MTALFSCYASSLICVDAAYRFHIGIAHFLHGPAGFGSSGTAGTVQKDRRIFLWNKGPDIFDVGNIKIMGPGDMLFLIFLLCTDIDQHGFGRAVEFFYTFIHILIFFEKI